VTDLLKPLVHTSLTVTIAPIIVPTSSKLARQP
jgi:hypothetical protein